VEEETAAVVERRWNTRVKECPGHSSALLGRGEIEKRKIKTRKPMHVLGLTLVQIHALISVFLFLSSQFLSYQARPKSDVETAKPKVHGLTCI
jgi:hypothetical protein